jgi:hypothetical protein
MMASRGYGNMAGLSLMMDPGQESDESSRRLGRMMRLCTPGGFWVVIGSERLARTWG